MRCKGVSTASTAWGHLAAKPLAWRSLEYCSRHWERRRRSLRWVWGCSRWHCWRRLSRMCAPRRRRRSRRVSLRACRRDSLALDQPAAEHFVAGRTAIEDSGLAGGNGALRLREPDLGAPIRQRSDERPLRGRLITPFYQRLEGLCWRLARRERRLADGEVSTLQCRRRADHHGIATAVEAQHVQRLARAQAQALALPNGVVREALVQA